MPNISREDIVLILYYLRNPQALASSLVEGPQLIQRLQTVALKAKIAEKKK